MSVTDLNICKDSTFSSESKSGICDCPEEYICVYDCPEGLAYSLSTLISWQHFPRSTSSRSRCDESEEIIKSSKSSSKTLSAGEESKSSQVLSTEYPISKSKSQLNALHYLEIRHVFEFFNFLISHLVCNEPQDPVLFLTDLLDKCLNYRDLYHQPPMLFTHAHIRSLYTAFDPFERGYLTVNQYKEAMRALGLENSITPYNKNPPLNEDGCVNEEDFVFEAETCLIENLRKMIRIPKKWEENPMLWKKRMAKKKQKELQSAKEFGNLIDEFEGEGREIYCKCSYITSNRACLCADAKIINEPEQLFLN